MWTNKHIHINVYINKYFDEATKQSDVLFRLIRVFKLATLCFADFNFVIFFKGTYYVNFHLHTLILRLCKKKVSK